MHVLLAEGASMESSRRFLSPSVSPSHPGGVDSRLVDVAPSPTGGSWEILHMRLPISSFFSVMEPMDILIQKMYFLSPG